MSWAVLSSGGKDSILSLQKAIDTGSMDIEYMVTVVPSNPDSYMFHSANLNAVPVISQRCGLKYIEIPSNGNKESELTDLEYGIKNLELDGVIIGAIESNYQRTRIEKICHNLNIDMYAPLWHKNPLDILNEVSKRMKVMIVVTAADGLGENVLGKYIDKSLIDQLCEISKKHRIHITGEGGEYESLTIDAPMYSTQISYSEIDVKYSCGRGTIQIGKFW